MVPTLGAIIVTRLLGSANLAGLATSTLGVSRFLVSYPVGKVADLYGRKVAVVLGLLLGLVGAVGTGLSILWSSFAFFVASIVVFGAGVTAGYQLRVAAADMYPPSRRGQGLGYVLTGSLVGTLGGPVLIMAAQVWSGPLGLDPIALAWLLVPAIVVPGIVLVLFVRPDPKEIAAHLEEYYPEYIPSRDQWGDDDARTGPLRFLRDRPKQVAFVASFAAQGNMSMMMALTPLALEHHGHTVPSISVAVAIHVMGMFGFSLPLGRLADTAGRRAVLLLGLLLAAVGTILVPLTSHYWAIVTGIFLIGVGWSAVTVAATAVIADTTRPVERGRAVGTNDTVGAASAVLLPLIAGPVVETLGLASLGIVGVGLVVPPLILLLTRLTEMSPGKYGEEHFPTSTLG